MLLHNHTTINFMPLLKLPLLNLLSKLDKKQLAWIAGFLDGDGHIGCRIIRRADYKFGFKLTPELSFTQKNIRGYHLFPALRQILGNIGSIRIKDKGVACLEIQGRFDAYAVLAVLYPHLVLKRKQAKYCMDIIVNYEQALANPNLFLDFCRKADRISALNDSRKGARIVTSAVVLKHFKSKRLV